MIQKGHLRVATVDPRVTAETALAAEVKRLLAGGQREKAAERCGAIIDRQQRRAARIAYHYLRDPAEVDDVVQDTFLRAFLHLSSFRDDLFFELWLTRILVNVCLDRIKAKKRRVRLFPLANNREQSLAYEPPSRELSPEATLLAKERRARLEVAVDRLPARQRTAVILSHFQGHSTRDVGVIMGLRESTVRVHLFRAMKKLRRLLDGDDRRARGWTASRSHVSPGA